MRRFLLVRGLQPLALGALLVCIAIACVPRDERALDQASEISSGVACAELTRAEPSEPVPHALSALLGTWHLDLHIDGVAPFPRAMRVGPRSTFGVQGLQVMFRSGHVLFRSEYDLGTTRVLWALDACHAPARRGSPSAPALRGVLRRCATFTDTATMARHTECLNGTFSATRLARLPGEAASVGLRFISEVREFPGSAAESQTANVRVRGDLAYLARFEDGLRIVDLREPSEPRHLGHVAPRELAQGEIYNDLKLLGRHALLASSRFGMVVVDVGDPSAPVQVTAFPVRGPNRTRVNVHSIFIEGTKAYLAELSFAGLRTVDLRDPAAPADRGIFAAPEAAVQEDVFVHDLSVRDGIAWLNYWGLGMVAVDLSTQPPRELGRFTYPRMTSHANALFDVAGRRYALHGDEDHGAHLRIVDVTTPGDARFMQQVSEVSLRPEVSIHNIEVHGTRAYIAWYQDGLRVLDVSNPARPTPVAHFNTWSPHVHPGESFYEGALGVHLDPARGRVYVADTHRGLIVLEDPALVP